MRIIISILFTIINLQSQIIDAIAIDVDGEPITTLEIQAVQSKLNMSKRGAIEALIKDRLEKSAIEKANIEVSPQEVDAKIAEIGSIRGLSVSDMKLALSKKGLTWEGYKKQLTLEIKKEKFFAKNIAPLIPRPTEDELRLYYETHRNRFKSSNMMSQISLIAYSSKSSIKLKEAIENPMKIVDGVYQKPLLVSSTDMNPQLFNIINSTPSGSFTKPINTGRGFVAYFVKSKSNQQDNSFEIVKNDVMMQWLKDERIKASKNFLSKLKNSANIRIIRL